ncbi:MAG: hypothetical protein ACLTXH_00480 [Enterobacter hormaechei]
MDRWRRRRTDFDLLRLQQLDEARFVVNRIKTWRRTAVRWSSVPFSIAATPSRACWKRRCCR